MKTHDTRTLRPGFPYARARSMGGGSLLCYEFYATRKEAKDHLRQLEQEPDRTGYPKQFVVFLPHLCCKAAVQ